MGLVWMAMAMAGTVEITHQSRVMSIDGTPLNGSVAVTASVCDDADAGACIEAVSVANANVSDGYVSFSIPVDTEALLAGDRWVELNVGGTILTPRQRLSHVPRAGVADVAQRIPVVSDNPGTTCTEADGTLVFDMQARAIRVCAAGTWTWIGSRSIVANGASGRSWSDGTYADSCEDYLNPPAGSIYQGNTGNGLYAIDPDGDTNPTATYCDMDGGGFTLLLSASASGTTFGNNASAWSTNTAIGTAAETLGTSEFRSTAYGDLVTDEVRLCYQDTDHCWDMPHNQARALQDFFASGHTYTQYSLNAVGYSNVGSSATMDAYLAAIGTTKHSRSVCFWLGINESRSSSRIGLLGDGSPTGCQPGDGYFDDLAIGVGLQSCYDANGCGPGGSGHLNGQQRGFDGDDNGLVRGPWHVFGR